jgi:hypothetical protein
MKLKMGDEYYSKAIFQNENLDMDAAFVSIDFFHEAVTLSRNYVTDL